MKLSQFKPTLNSNQKTNSDQKVEDIFNTYKDMNSNQLMQELLKNVQKSKQDGTFNFEKLSQSIKQVSPYLSQEQQNSVMEILGKIK